MQLNLRSACFKGAVPGAAAGAGAIVLAPYMGLGSAPSRRTTQTKLAFLGYLLGGLVAGGVAEWLSRDSARH